MWKKDRMQQNLKWQDEVVDFYYQESTKNLEEIARENSLSFDECHRYFRSLSWISNTFQKWPEEEPASWLAGKILAQAREQGAKAGVWGIFPSWFRPGAVLASVVTAFAAGLLAYSTLFVEPMAKSDTVQVIASRTLDNQELPEVSVPFVAMRPYFKNHLHEPFSAMPQISPVSVGHRFVDPLRDPELDQKILTQSALTSSELESLFFRGRKFQQMGYYREALRDFQFIGKFYPKFKQTQAIQLAIANCYEALEENENAISVLQKFEKNYGDSREIDLWIDELKSESF